MSRRRSGNPFASFALAMVLSAVAMPSQAGSLGNGSAGSGQAGFKTLQQFRYEADAEKHCLNDEVVWGSSENPGKFYIKDAGPQRIGGFYACKAEARTAGYEIVTGK